MPADPSGNGEEQGDYPLLGVAVLLALGSALFFDGRIVTPILTVAFLFYGTPWLWRRVAGRFFDDPVQRAALFAAVVFFVLGLLESLGGLGGSGGR